MQNQNFSTPGFEGVSHLDNIQFHQHCRWLFGSTKNTLEPQIQQKLVF